MNKTIYLLKSTVSVFIIFFAFYAKAEVLEATDIGIIKDEIAKLKSGDMVLLDVKHVIFTPVIRLCSMNINRFLNKNLLKSKQILVKRKQPDLKA